MLARLLKDTLIVSLLTITLWLVIIDLFEYLFTYKWYLLNSVSIETKTITLVVVFLVCTLFFYKKEQLLDSFVLIFFVVVITSHGIYTNYYQYLQNSPQIKSISKKWSIQGDIITIKGKNFGDEWERGAIWAGETDMIIKSWSNYKIVFEQPVPTGFTTDKLMLCKASEFCTSISPYQVRDPSEVLE